jgi:hypothetical protein
VVSGSGTVTVVDSGHAPWLAEAGWLFTHMVCFPALLVKKEAEQRAVTANARRPRDATSSNLGLLDLGIGERLLARFVRSYRELKAPITERMFCVDRLAVRG